VKGFWGSAIGRVWDSTIGRKLPRPGFTRPANFRQGHQVSPQRLGGRLNYLSHFPKEGSAGRSESVVAGSPRWSRGAEGLDFYVSNVDIPRQTNLTQDLHAFDADLSAIRGADQPVGYATGAEPYLLIGQLLQCSS